MHPVHILKGTHSVDIYRWGQKKLFQEAGRVEKTWTELAQTFSNTNLQIFCQKLWNWKKVFLIQNHNFGLKYCYFFPAVKLTQPPESPYTRRNKMIFWGARTQACADFGAIGAIAQKIYLRKSDACVDVCGGFKQKKEIRESFLKKSDVLYVNACGGFPKKNLQVFLRKFAHGTRLQKNLQVFCAILYMRQAGFVYITHFPPWLQEQAGWRSGQSGG